MNDTNSSDNKQQQQRTRVSARLQQHGMPQQLAAPPSTTSAAAAAAAERPWLAKPPLLVHSFANNIRAFLAGRWATPVPIVGLPRVTAHIVELGPPTQPTLLHVYEERLGDADGAVCDECRCMGASRRVADSCPARLGMWRGCGCHGRGAAAAQ
jgi:hypothetical protein